MGDHNHEGGVSDYKVPHKEGMTYCEALWLKLIMCLHCSGRRIEVKGREIEKAFWNCARPWSREGV